MGEAVEASDLHFNQAHARDGGEKDIKVDWLGRPAISRRLKTWKSITFIMGAGMCGYLAFGGIYFNLVLYLLRVWHEGSATAANDFTNLMGTMFFTSILGAFLGDAYWGRLWTVLVFLVIFFLGSTLLCIAVQLQQAATYVADPPKSLKTFVFASLYIAALGNGSYEPVLAALGGDQLDNSRHKTTFFNFFFVACNVGQLLALTLITYFENNGHWATGFWICAAAVLLAMFLFFFGAPHSKQFAAGGNPISRVLQVLVSATRKIHANNPSDPNLLYELPGKQSAIPGTRKIAHSNSIKWLDKAAIMSASDFRNGEKTPNPWRLSTVTQVEEVKCLIRLVPYVLAGSLYSTLVAQQNTFFIEQGATMNPRLGPNFKIPPGSMQVFTVGACIVFTPIYDRMLVSWARKWTGHPKGITTLQRMGWGFVISIISMVVAAIVEKKRLNSAKSHGLSDTPFQPVPLSIFWLVPQYAIQGISLVFVVVGQIDFFYTELSDGMRSVGVSLPLVCRGAGNYASSLLVTIVNSLTRRGGKRGWIPRNLNRAHLDYFYWLLAALMLITLLLYLVCAYFYTYLEIPEHEEAEVHPTHAEAL